MIERNYIKERNKILNKNWKCNIISEVTKKIIGKNIKINDEMSSFMKQVLESANMTNEGKWPIHQLQKVTTCLESRTKFD